MELEQLHEAGSSQTEQRAAAEMGVKGAAAAVQELEDTVRERTERFQKADGRRPGGGGSCMLWVAWLEVGVVAAILLLLLLL